MNQQRDTDVERRIRGWQRMREEFGDQAPLPLRHFIDHEIAKLRAQEGSSQRAR